MPDYVPSDALRHATERFVQWSTTLLKVRDWSSQKVLFHYTTADNFEKIIASKELWLTRLQAQKDPTELKFGLDLFRQVVEENMEGASPSPLHRIFFQQLLRLDEEAFSVSMDCHVACFAPHGEDFDLWEQYGDRGRGVAIGTKPEFCHVKPPEPGEPPWAVQPVTYGTPTPLHEFRKLLQVVSMALGETAPLISNSRDHKYVNETLQHQLVAGHVLPICMLAKSDLYNQETEIRILAPYSRTNGERPKHHISIPFRPEMIDHVRIGENADRARIEAIVEPYGLKVETALFSRGLSTGTNS